MEEKEVLVADVCDKEYVWAEFLNAIKTINVGYYKVLGYVNNDWVKGNVEVIKGKAYFTTPDGLKIPVKEIKKKKKKIK